MSANSTSIVIAEKIHLAKAKIIKSSIDCPFDFERKNVKGHELNVNFELAFNLDDLLVKVDFTVEVSTKSSVTIEREAFGSFHFAYVFHVENLKELAIPNEDKRIELDGGLGNALASITYSTSRGILLSRLAGTALGDFILPVINPDSLLKEG